MNPRRLLNRVAVFVDRTWGYVPAAGVLYLIGVVAAGGW